MRFLIFLLFFTSLGFAQTNSYNISFSNAEHHEAKIIVNFPEIEQDSLIVRMSRTSPGRYALHEFAKNVYGVKATNSKGEALGITRPDPYSWLIKGHDGTVNLEYTLFGNRADGTYSQIDQSHAHLNIPATFIYAEGHEERPVEVTFETEAFPDWKIATQLKHEKNNTYSAPGLYYFMDSPTELSDHAVREFELDGQTIKFALHGPATEAEFNQYFEQVKKIVEQQKRVFGELPKFDFGEYVFIACYLPHASGDGMEHRNSTILTSTRILGEGGIKRNIGTVAHEFFHAWNVERIRPQDLEPFDFREADMSGLLWFAEGFTSYYTPLTLVRSGIITPEEYAEGLNGSFNYVWNSPAREYFNPVEMSYQAPFVDAATSVDPVNRENTFISYYSYGSMLGLALDLQLRQKGQNLDEFMEILWEKYGKPGNPYTLQDLETTLADYAGKDLASEFFSKYIYNSKMPDYENLFKTVGLKIEKASEKAFFGTSIQADKDTIYISENPRKNTPAFKAGLNLGDRIISLNGTEIKSEEAWEEMIENSEVGDNWNLEIERFGNTILKSVKLEQDPTYQISIDKKASSKAVKAREDWLSGK
ncbi:Predicted metalloprotease, contains C-terminal PDZ domain [Salinimicrobium sediminis]|uniref:Predicted metalloprotease, contains C-terminal PDZ domain n=1 Tax=Salinimicrobium sediminis TaxID=1343891 RepID=A0A285X195_9FLAO|nr:PDZ domain-containing protein [Salinimicrobium sediminis]SOC79095.1 Predicted metalloprotease, contains C-terminal PDZ domain [Salinimicrobium sediminis]